MKEVISMHIAHLWVRENRFYMRTHTFHISRNTYKNWQMLIKYNCGAHFQEKAALFKI